MSAGLFDGLDAAAKQAEQERVSERVRLRFEQQRAEREAYWASRTESDILRMRIEQSARDFPDPVTRAFLQTCVPLYIETHRSWSDARLESKARALGDIIAHEQGTAALSDPEARGTAKKGDIAKAFNAVAQGLAVLAYCPGGVVFAGCHWEAKP